MTGNRGLVVGDGAFLFPTVGTSFHQQQIEKICGGRTAHSARHFCAALLVPQPHNPYDRHAIVVIVHGVEVAHLDREDARDFGQALAAGGFADAACEAKIVGGWDRGGTDVGYFGVRLNAILPFKIVSPGLHQETAGKPKAKWNKVWLAIAVVVGLILLQLIFTGIFAPN